MDDIQKTVQKLIEAKEAYYNSDVPTMTDAEFDALEERLRGLDPENEYFSIVGADITAGKKITHSIPMLSMQKGKTAADIAKWIDWLDLKTDSLFPAEFCIQPKIDGLSATVKYLKGKLVYVATRGDGLAGQDITHIAEYVDDIRKTISFSKDEVEVRGELYLPKNTKLDTGGRPLRNNCVGLINRKEKREDLSHVRFVAYQITGSFAVESEQDKISLLKKDKFNSVEIALCSSAEEIDSYYTKYLSTLRAEWEFETDGLIITLNDNRLHADIDARKVVDHHHHYSIALKPPAEERETKLLRIEWQVSRQGSVVPVAVFEPVIIGGARIERASLSNYETVTGMKLHEGDRLLIERANDVIPYVKENLSASEHADDSPDRLAVSRCPSCDTTLTVESVHLKCRNADCPETNIQKILYWIKESNVENVAEATVRTLYVSRKIRTIADLYSLTAEDFSGIAGFAEKKIANFTSELKRSRAMSAPEFISKLGIPLVQLKAIRKMNISSVQSFRDFIDETYVIGQNIIRWKSDPANMRFFDELASILDITDGAARETKGKVCMTGKGPLGRNELAAKIEEMGYEFSDDLTKDTAILLCEDVNGTSSKLQKARKYGVKLVSYDEFFG